MEILLLKTLWKASKVSIFTLWRETNVTASNDGLNATMGLQAGGTESNDNSLLSISGGTHFVNAPMAMQLTVWKFFDDRWNVFANGPTAEWKRLWIQR
jgi:hypothetical protein